MALCQLTEGFLLDKKQRTAAIMDITSLAMSPERAWKMVPGMETNLHVKLLVRIFFEDLNFICFGAV